MSLQICLWGVVLLRLICEDTHTHCGWHHSMHGILDCYINVESELSSRVHLSSASWLDGVWPGAVTLTSPLQTVASTFELWTRINPFSLKLLLYLITATGRGTENNNRGSQCSKGRREEVGTEKGGRKEWGQAGQWWPFFPSGYFCFTVGYLRPLSYRLDENGERKRMERTR